MKNFTLIAIAVCVLAAMSLPVRADMMSYNGLGLNKTITIHKSIFFGIIDWDKTTPAGQLSITYKDQDFDTYCVDIYNYIGSGNVTEKPITSINNGLAAGWLWLNHAHLVDTDTYAASLQSAIWEVIYESHGWDVTNGNFYITGNNDVAAGANDLLNSIPDNPEAPGMVVLHSPCKQDVLIPEPGTLILLASGGIGIVFRKVRRS